MNIITLKRSILTSRNKIINAGTLLYFDDDDSTTFEDETIFLYRINHLCYELIHCEESKYPPEYPDSRDEMLEEEECILYDEGANGLGEMHVIRMAYSSHDCIELAREFNSHLRWDWLYFNTWNSIAIIAENEVDSYLILTYTDCLSFRFHTYAFSLSEEELTEKHIGNNIVSEIENRVKYGKLFAFGRGEKWIEQQVSERGVGRNGNDIKVKFIPDTDTLYVLCEIEGGQLMILPYGKDYGVQVFAYDNIAFDKIYSRSDMRMAISYSDSLELVAKIESSDINDCKVAVINDSAGNETYIESFNRTELGMDIFTYIPSIEQCISIKCHIEHIKRLLSVKDALAGVNSTIRFIPVRDAYYKCMRVNPVIRLRAESAVNKSLGLSTDHVIICFGEYAYGMLENHGHKMIIDIKVNIKDIDFSEMEFTQFKGEEFGYDEEKFNSDILDDFDFKPSIISEADFLKIKPCKSFLNPSDNV